MNNPERVSILRHLMVMAADMAIQRNEQKWRSGGKPEGRHKLLREKLRALSKEHFGIEEIWHAGHALKTCSDFVKDTMQFQPSVYELFQGDKKKITMDTARDIFADCLHNLDLSDPREWATFPPLMFEVDGRAYPLSVGGNRTSARGLAHSIDLLYIANVYAAQPVFHDAPMWNENYIQDISMVTLLEPIGDEDGPLKVWREIVRDRETGKQGRPHNADYKTFFAENPGNGPKSIMAMLGKPAGWTPEGRLVRTNDHWVVEDFMSETINALDWATQRYVPALLEADEEARATRH